MGIKSDIGYIDSSANPIRGCGGCELWTTKNKVCYAGKFISRFVNQTHWPAKFTKPIMVPGIIERALKWPDLTGTDREDKPWLNGMSRIIFLNDMSDTFTEHVYFDGAWTKLPITWLAPYMHDMINSPHIYMLLTKRPRRAVKFFQQWGSVPANFWVGTSITYGYTTERARILAQLAPICEGKLWLSIEPLYARLDLYRQLQVFDWVAVGGESGINTTPTELSWISQIISDCKATDTPVFVKQLGSASGYGSKGQDWDKWPATLRVREMPENTDGNKPSKRCWKCNKPIGANDRYCSEECEREYQRFADENEIPY